MAILKPQMNKTETAEIKKNEKIEACERQILEFLQSLEKSGAVDISNGGDAAKQLASIYIQMGEEYLAIERHDPAVTCFETALKIDPDNMTARLRSVKARKEMAPEYMAKAVLEALVAKMPKDANLLGQLGSVQNRLHESEAALQNFYKAHVINPEDGNNFYGIATALQNMGENDVAKESYVKASQLSPLVKTPANKTPADFSVLMIFTPFVGNTPTEFLIANTSFETNQFTFLHDQEHDIDLLKRSGQVIVNMTSEADMAHSVLPQIEKMIDRLDMPVINHPAKLKRTNREDISILLRDIPGCKLARVARHIAGEPTTPEELQKKISFPFPLLARVAGKHGGKDFEKIDTLEALSAFIGLHPDEDHYLIEYIDYQSPDGHFRKYRFIFVNDKIMPYHLAIGDDWKVHHGSTNMDKHEWMQDEEKAYLENPHGVFSKKNYESLRAIQKAIDLEYFGIDCGLDRDGNLVVFEVNATMLVHGRNENFPYKTPFVKAIKSEFCEMLRKHADIYKKTHPASP